MQRRVLNFMVSLRRLPPLSSLSGQEERMLFDLLDAHQSGRTLLVRDAMHIGELPPATAYRHVIALRKKGLIDFISDPHDARKKEIVFLPPAVDLLKQLS
jgi:DNA-binding MarR family transcriptional regulator